jgi:hypothetical protein
VKLLISIFILVSYQVSIVFGVEQERIEGEGQTAKDLVECGLWLKNIYPFNPADFSIMVCYLTFEVEGKYPNLMTDYEQIKMYEKIEKIVNMTNIMN